MSPTDLINDRSLWQELAALFDASRPDKFDRLQIAHRIRHDLGSDLHERLAKLFEKCFTDKLPRPPIILPDELAEFATHQLAGIRLGVLASKSQKELENEHPEVLAAKRRFIAFVDSAIQDDVFGDGDVTYDLGKWIGENDHGAQYELWRSPYFELYASVQNDVFTYRASGWLEGTCTERAMAHAATKLKPVVESIATTVRYTTVTKDEEQFRHLVEGEGERIFRASLSSFFGEFDELNGDVLESVKLATKCLVSSDAQSSHELALAQSFAAIEALICFDTKQITKQICSYVPTLLHPPGLGRTEKGDVLKTLYGMRSSVVHGSHISVSEDARRWTRRIAGGVVRAVLLWREYQQRMNDETTRSRLLEDLRFAAGDGKSMAQVGIDLSNLLPESPTQPFREPPTNVLDIDLNLI